jgi:hypothetical protein
VLQEYGGASTRPLFVTSPTIHKEIQETDSGETGAKAFFMGLSFKELNF